CMEGLDFQWTF
nr:immunoglobulin light chain junction region [Macaca mulatta]MOV62656.1 immunoglobulin light chain junction region [Macaca mulatta]MOV64818.1 immunoglobulin light chain junction region [Macaca mulatta]